MENNINIKRGRFIFDAPVTSIGRNAFSRCSKLASITIPESVTSIGNDSFRNCSSLTSIVIPNSVTSIGRNAFDGCNSLTSIVVEESNVMFDSRENCHAIIETATNNLILGCINTTIPDSVTTIQSGAFKDLDFTQIMIPQNITNIESGAFTGCSNVISIVVDDSNTVYDSRNNCNAVIISDTGELVVGCKNTIIDDTITKISSLAFRYSLLESVDIPDTVTEIGSFAFSNCPFLKTANIGNGITKLNYGVFGYCTGLESVTISNSLKSFDMSVFLGCTALIDFNYNGTIEEWKSVGKNAPYWRDLVPATVVHCTDGDVSF